MSKYRVYELAKEFQTESKVVLDILKRNNHEVKNHMSSVGEEERSIVARTFAPKKEEKVKSAPAPEKKAQPQTSQKPASTAPKAPERRSEQAGNKQNPQPSNRQGNRPQQASASRNRPGQGNWQSRSQQGGGNSQNRDSNSNQRPGSRDNRGGSRPNQSGQQNNRNQAGSGNSRNQSGSQRPNSGASNRGDNRGAQGGGSMRNQGGNNRPGSSYNRNRNQSGSNRFGKKGKGRDRGQQVQQAPKAEIARPTHIKVGETIAVKDLASKMSLTAGEIIKKLFMMGTMATINQEIDFDTAALVAEEFGVTCEELPPETDPTEIPEIEDDPKTLVDRPPVVTVMGHVDHGKTSLLDAIRKTSVSSTEAGGITQHIGAYQVKSQGKKIVFLDTPGHEAFTAMRARGAQVTDIAILVVAADDGVMPQTIEAINHAKSADVPIIVAINKIDKPGANPEHVKQELAEHELIPEDWGGDTIMVPVSAKQKMGISELLEMVLLVAEVRELKANPNREARGVVIEAQLDKGRGPVASILVQSGTLRVGDSVVAGTTFGKVRAMINDRGENVKKAGPSVPVEILGLSDVPEAGDVIAAIDEKLARSIALKRQERKRTELVSKKNASSFEDLNKQIREGAMKDFNIVIKGDVQGSVEALSSSLLSLNKNDEVRVSIVHSGVGAVKESDVMLAAAANAVIIAFNVRPDANARRKADEEEIEIRTYRVIYDALNDVKDAMSGLLAPKYNEVGQGKVEIRQVMEFNKVRIAGSYVLEGKITRSSKIRIVRDNIEIFDGELDSLRRFKDDVKEVAAGYECGLTVKDFRDYREGDIIEAYTMEEIETSIADANKEAAARKAEEEAAAAKATGED
ncbi:translation initiation factor IF-2 [Selenomonas sp. TAMA-11512]|uniref:translation initiation factor IF-2 n=1 Tax=Selenomonas sp. TAMA-11512 TaxID=3095337 RepID=UPI0030887FB9|nr:translation initiation factor IF-2 [Selenomonas sp. TAMA-11512]